MQSVSRGNERNFNKKLTQTSEVIASKNMKIQAKIKSLEEEIEKMKATKQQYQALFKEIYQKHMTEENKEGVENPEAQKS